MSRLRMQCISWTPFAATPWTRWRTYCGKVVGAGRVQHDWPPPASKRPAGVCPRCWTHVCAFGRPIPNDNAGGEP